MYDIAIVGLGPAGATLARLLDQKYKIIALDKKDLTGQAGFQKPCGGLLAADAQKSLSRFNLTLPKEILVDPQIFAVRTVDTGQDLERYYQRFYINMDRHKFDLWLAGLIPSRVDIVDRAAVTSIRRNQEGYSITYRRGEEVFAVEARYLIGVDGAHSAVRRVLFPEKKIRRYLSIQEWYVDQNSRPLYGCFFDAGITDCYAWSISKDGYFIFGGAFPVENAQEGFETLKHKLEARGYIFGQTVKREACLVLRPRGFRDYCLGKDQAFLAGEAAGLISPSSLEGISYALDSAVELAQVFNSAAPDFHRAYSRRMIGLRFKLWAKNIKSVFMYHPLLRRLIMASKIQSIDVVDDGIS